MRFLLRAALQYSEKEAKPPRIAEASPCQLRMIVEVSPIRGAGSNASPSLCGAEVRFRKIFFPFCKVISWQIRKTRILIQIIWQETQTRRLTIIPTKREAQSLRLHQYSAKRLPTFVNPFSMIVYSAVFGEYWVLAVTFGLCCYQLYVVRLSE